MYYPYASQLSFFWPFLVPVIAFVGTIILLRVFFKNTNSRPSIFVKLTLAVICYAVFAFVFGSLYTVLSCGQESLCSIITAVLLMVATALSLSVVIPFQWFIISNWSKGKPAIPVVTPIFHRFNKIIIGMILLVLFLPLSDFVFNNYKYALTVKSYNDLVLIGTSDYSFDISKFSLPDVTDWNQKEIEKRKCLTEVVGGSISNKCAMLLFGVSNKEPNLENTAIEVSVKQNIESLKNLQLSLVHIFNFKGKEKMLFSVGIASRPVHVIDHFLGSYGYSVSGQYLILVDGDSNVIEASFDFPSAYFVGIIDRNRDGVDELLFTNNDQQLNVLSIKEKD